MADELFAINDEEDVSTGSTTLELQDPIASLQDDDEDEKVAEDEYGAASEEDSIESELEYCKLAKGDEAESSPQPCEKIASETHAKPKTRLFSNFILYTQPLIRHKRHSSSRLDLIASDIEICKHVSTPLGSFVILSHFYGEESSYKSPGSFTPFRMTFYKHVHSKNTSYLPFLKI